MSEFDREIDSMTWAGKKGITTACQNCGTIHDSHIECPKCKQEEMKNKKGIFDNVIWPDARK